MALLHQGVLIVTTPPYVSHSRPANVLHVPCFLIAIHENKPTTKRLTPGTHHFFVVTIQCVDKNLCV
jgi:hypothetical protein